MKELQFDVVIHLAGEQSVPNYMAVKLSESPRHILLTTTKTKQQYRLLEGISSTKERQIRHVEVPATDYAGIKKELSDIIEIQGVRVGVNVTGGTKPMFAAALDFCRESGATPFYLDTQERMISFFAGDNAKIPMPKVFESVEEFVRLGGYRVAGAVKRCCDISDSRRELIKLFWQNKDWVRRKIAEFSEATGKKYQSKATNPPSCYTNAKNFILSPRPGNKKEELLAKAWKAVFPHDCDWRKAARFGAGEWFEEWVLLQFGNSSKKDDFIDLCSGVSLAFENQNANREVQEIDVVYTDGYQLTLIECKAGAVAQEHVQKLENLRRQIGGAMGCGFLCAINRQDGIIVERIKNGSISLIAGDQALRMLPNRHNAIKPRMCYQDERDYELR